MHFTYRVSLKKGINCSSSPFARGRRGSSDAALAPYHVERSMLFVLDRLASAEEVDAARIARAIAMRCR